MRKNQRKQRIDKLYTDYEAVIDSNILLKIKKGMIKYLIEGSSTLFEKLEKVKLREYLVGLVQETNNEKLMTEIYKILYRPMDEMYIPTPNSARFHRKHPNFFGKNYGKMQEGTSKLSLSKEKRRFSLVFEPSGDILPAYITQDNGKAIESTEKQIYLGEWILRGVFQLDKYEPLTSERLKELNINRLKFTKYKGSDNIHLEFIWIDENNPPKGYISPK